MDPLSTLPPASEVTELYMGNSCCQIHDGFLSVTLPTMYSLIFTVGLLSNVLALWVFSCSMQRRTSITVYMRNLALSDLLLTLCLPFRIAFQGRSEPHVFCNIVGAFFYLNMYVSISFLSLISLDRYLKIIWPLQKYRIHTVSCSTLASGMVWVVSSAFMMPFFFEKRGKGPCDLKCFHFRSKSTMAASFNMATVAAFFIVLLLFLYFYSKIFAKLHQVSSMKAQQLNKKTSTRAITKTFVVLIIFIVCFTPYHIVRIPYILAQVGAIASLPWKQGLHLANELVLCISALNSCLDPIIFFFLSSSFRRAVLCTIRGRLKGALMSNQGRLTPSRSVTEL
ncbi:probable G-protein coupled receptor 34 [Cyrtonyx montezumae]|uniref:probable G-protein coupled receptor 34 n=1 Tax=Cyrtonyx montezumae TaxID=9017 RepID=UPI0032D9E730